MNFWLIILGMGVVTYVIRVLLIFLFGGFTILKFSDGLTLKTMACLRLKLRLFLSSLLAAGLA